MGSALLRQLITRCLEAAISVWGVVTLAFFLAHAAPGGPAYAILGLRPKPVSVTEVDLQLGINTPLLHQYTAWWAHLAQGSLGTSYLLNRPVTQVLAEYTATSATLLAAGLILGIALSFALGLLHGIFYHRWPGRLLGAAELTLYATPSFVAGTILALIFAAWLPSGGTTNLHLPAPTWPDTLRHLILPAATLALAIYASLARFFAESIRAALTQDFTRTATARGLPPHLVLRRHVIPNALRPCITLLGLILPGLFAAAVVVESLFAYPGLGWLLWRSAVAQDYPVLVGIVLLVGIATVAGTLLADTVNMLIDPRLRDGT